MNSTPNSDIIYRVDELAAGEVQRAREAPDLVLRAILMKFTCLLPGETPLLHTRCLAQGAKQHHVELIYSALSKGYDECKNGEGYVKRFVERLSLPAVVIDEALQQKCYKAACMLYHAELKTQALILVAPFFDGPNNALSLMLIGTVLAGLPRPAGNVDPVINECACLLEDKSPEASALLRMSLGQKVHVSKLSLQLRRLELAKRAMCALEPLPSVALGIPSDLIEPIAVFKAERSQLIVELIKEGPTWLDKLLSICAGGTYKVLQETLNEKTEHTLLVAAAYYCEQEDYESSRKCLECAYIVLCATKVRIIGKNYPRQVPLSGKLYALEYLMRQRSPLNKVSEHLDEELKELAKVYAPHTVATRLLWDEEYSFMFPCSELLLEYFVTKSFLNSLTHISES